SQNLGGCTEKYSDAVTSLMRNLVTLDQVVVESMIWHARWKTINTQRVSNKISILSDVQQMYEYAIERQKLYFDNWNIKSYPRLDILNAKISETEKIHCDKGISYEGISTYVQCMDFTLKTLNQYNVTCSMTANGTLEWLGIPECNFATSWGHWTEWSECSATCDSGTQIRYRRSTDGQIQNRTQACNSGVLCCTESYVMVLMTVATMKMSSIVDTYVLVMQLLSNPHVENGCRVVEEIVAITAQGVIVLGKLWIVMTGEVVTGSHLTISLLRIG
ncbi:unnamed protein product, partial [Meganyctiphanes norvegica]